MESWQRAFVLHSRHYSETSLLLDIFTENNGKIRLLAKGARSRRSTIKGCLQPFTPLLLQWYGRGAIKTLRAVESVSLALPLSGMTLYSGLYVNELLMRILEPETAYPVLFFDYLTCIQELAGEKNTTEASLRCFELALLAQMGYGIDFLHCAITGDPIVDNMTYRYYLEKGFVSSVMIDRFSFTGRELSALAQRKFPDTATLQAAKRFTRLALKPYLGNKPLKSRELFRQSIKNN